MATGRRRNSYKFTEKTHSKKGIAAFTISALLLVVYGLVVGLAFREAQGLSMYYGSIGVTAMLIAFVALVLSIQSLGEENSFQLFPRLAVLASAVCFFGWVGTYVIGFIY